MKRTFTTIFLALGIICKGQTTDLALHLVPGTSYRHTTTSSSSIIETINGQKQTIDMAINSNMVYLVKEIDGDRYKMEVQYKSLAMEIGWQMERKNSVPKPGTPAMSFPRCLAA